MKMEDVNPLTTDEHLVVVAEDLVVVAEDPAAVADHLGVEAIELRDVYFLSPMQFVGDEAKDVRVVLQGDAFHILSRVADDRWLEHARGEAGASTADVPVRPAPPAAGPTSPRTCAVTR